jgi:hypothetical protein
MPESLELIPEFRTERQIKAIRMIMLAELEQENVTELFTNDLSR